MMHTPVGQKVDAYLRERRMRRTYERYTILEKALSFKAGFSIENLHDALVADGEMFSLTTLYQAMALLCDAGVMCRHTYEGKRMLYQCTTDIDGTATPFQKQLICRICGSVHDLRSDDMEISELRTGRFRPEYATVYVYGLCGKCRRKESKIKQKT